MELIERNTDRKNLKRLAEEKFGNLVKAVIDIEKKVMAVGAELHADEESFLLERGSKQENLWGINLYPDKKDNNFIEFDSMINLRPSQGNKTRGIDNPELREEVRNIIAQLVT